MSFIEHMNVTTTYTETFGLKCVSVFDQEIS